MFYVQIPSLIVDHSLVMVGDRRFTEMWWWCKLPMWDGNIGSSIKKKRVSFSLSHMAPACQKEYAWKYIFVYHASIQVPKHNSLKLFRPSDTNVSEKSLLIFWRSQKSECKPLLAHLQSKMHDLEKNQTIITRYYPWSVTDNKSFKGYKTILKSKNTDGLSPWHVKMFLGSAFSSFPPLHFLPPHPTLNF